jgi:hypothetical protein
MEVLPAPDGVLHAEEVLSRWRQLGIRFVSANPKQRRSYGALGCTISHLSALRWQVRHALAFMLRLEDDVKVTNASLLRRVVCVATRYLTERLPTEPRLLDTVRFGLSGAIGSEAQMTSLEGAKAILREFCLHGITDNIDYMLNDRPGTLRITAAMSIRLFRLLRPSGKGHIRKESGPCHERHCAQNGELGMGQRNVPARSVAVIIIHSSCENCGGPLEA